MFVKKILRVLRNSIKPLYRISVSMQCKSYKLPLNVNGFSIVSNKTILGKNINFNGIRISGCGNVIIEDNFHSGKNCLIITQNHNYEGTKIPYDETYICKDIHIEENVWIGDRVIILGGITIGEGAIIQAGSVIVGDIPKYAIAGGHPATVFSNRNIEHYQNLKQKKLFL